MPRVSIRGFGITFDRLRIPIGFGATFALLVLFLCHSWYGPDIWYHLTWGRSLIETGGFLPETGVLLQQPIVANIYWFFQMTVFGVLLSGGLVGVSLLFVLLWMGIAMFWMVMTGAGRSRVVGPLMFLAFVCCAQLRFEHRPEILSYFLLSLMMALLLARDLNLPLDGIFIFKLFFVQVVWSNSHGYFALGPLLGLALIVSTLASRYEARGPRVLRAAKITAVLAVGSLISPFTWHNWELVFDLLKVGRGLRHINQELMPPQLFPIVWPMHLFWALWAMTGAWSLRELYRRQNIFAAVMALAGAILALQATRNFPLYLILSAPALAGVIHELDSYLVRINGWARRAIYFLPALAALGLAISVVTNEYYFENRSLATFGIHLEKASYPIGAVQFLERIQFSAKIFNDSYDGGYLEFFLPKVKIAGDSYFSDAELTKAYFSAIKEPTALMALDKKFVFDALLINVENLAVVELLWRDPQWVLAYADSHRLLYMRRTHYSGTALSLNDLRLYDGENLRHWVYAYGVTSWAGLALRFNEPALAAKVLAELGKSPYVPSTAIRYLLGFAVRAKNREIGAGALALLPKMYESGFGDIGKIDELQTEFRAL